MTPMQIKDTHDWVPSPMSPTYCRRCKKSGYELQAAVCRYYKPASLE